MGRYPEILDAHQDFWNNTFGLLSKLTKDNGVTIYRYMHPIRSEQEMI